MNFTTHTNEFDGPPTPRCECCGEDSNSPACDECLDADCDGMGTCKRPKTRIIRYAGTVLARASGFEVEEINPENGHNVWPRE